MNALDIAKQVEEIVEENQPVSLDLDSLPSFPPVTQEEEDKLIAVKIKAAIQKNKEDLYFNPQNV